MSMRSQFICERIVGKVGKRGLKHGGSLFRHVYGRVMTTAATEFVVIRKLGVMPYVYSKKKGKRKRIFNGGVNIRINSTEYFVNPDGSAGNKGISGRLVREKVKAKSKKKKNFLTKLRPDLYVLQGQRWDIVLRFEHGDKIKKGECIYVLCEYTLYEGSDSVLANQLLEMGRAVSPKNIDDLKRMLVTNDAASSTDDGQFLR